MVAMGAGVRRSQMRRTPSWEAERNWDSDCGVRLVEEGAEVVGGAVKGSSAVGWGTPFV